MATFNDNTGQPTFFFRSLEMSDNPCSTVLLLVDFDEWHTVGIVLTIRFQRCITRYPLVKFIFRILEKSPILPLNPLGVWWKTHKNIAWVSSNSILRKYDWIVLWKSFTIYHYISIAQNVIEFTQKWVTLRSYMTLTPTKFRETK